MKHSFKVGDKVRVSGLYWGKSHLVAGTILSIEEERREGGVLVEVESLGRCWFHLDELLSFEESNEERGTIKWVFNVGEEVLSHGCNFCTVIERQRKPYASNFTYKVKYGDGSILVVDEADLSYPSNEGEERGDPFYSQGFFEHQGARIEVYQKGEKRLYLLPSGYAYPTIEEAKMGVGLFQMMDIAMWMKEDFDKVRKDAAKSE